MNSFSKFILFTITMFMLSGCQDDNRRSRKKSRRKAHRTFKKGKKKKGKYGK